MAAGLVAMVCRLSIGRPDMEPEAFYRKIASEAEALAQRLFDGASQDSMAFQMIGEAYKMPKSSQEEKEKRRLAMERAFLRAAEVPLANAEACCRVLELGREIAGRYNPSAASDLKCAGYLAQAGLKGCLANVEINLDGIKDQASRDRLGQRMRELAKAAGAGGLG
jgi:formiminotetrahydrofolate cyclodeaminase